MKFKLLAVLLIVVVSLVLALWHRAAAVEFVRGLSKTVVALIIGLGLLIITYGGIRYTVDKAEAESRAKKAEIERQKFLTEEERRQDLLWRRQVERLRQATGSDSGR